MDDKIKIQITARRIVSRRSVLIKKFPFFGRLLLRLKIAFSECQTAFTDGERIVYDVDFVSCLTDEELDFLMLHELMHVLHKHCTRRKERIPYIYNIACDIVVNSCIMQMMSVSKFKINGIEVMHQTPDGFDGYRYSTDEVYRMLISNEDEDVLKKLEKMLLDGHDIWDDIPHKTDLESKWAKYKKYVLLSRGEKGLSFPWMERVFSDIDYKSTIDWRIVLNEFLNNDKKDYSFTPADRRFAESPFIIPGFGENAEGGSVDNIWVCVDTSGSIDDECLAMALEEIKNTIRQIEGIQGCISFFDDKITEPIYFSSTEDVEQLSVIGGGGTDFENIFESIETIFSEPPKAIIILTDGQADFPEESSIPTIWAIIKSNIIPPWGRYVQVE